MRGKRGHFMIAAGEPIGFGQGACRIITDDGHVERLAPGRCGPPVVRAHQETLSEEREEQWERTGAESDYRDFLTRYPHYLPTYLEDRRASSYWIHTYSEPYMDLFSPMELPTFNSDLAFFRLIHDYIANNLETLSHIDTFNTLYLASCSRIIKRGTFPGL